MPPPPTSGSEVPAAAAAAACGAFPRGARFLDLHDALGPIVDDERCAASSCLRSGSEAISRLSVP